MPSRFVVDRRAIESFDDFVDRMNDSLIRHTGGMWRGNLDALNDYLSWPEDTPYELLIRGVDRCRQALGRRFDRVLEVIQDNEEAVRVVLEG